MVFRISKIHTNADFTFSNNKNEKAPLREAYKEWYGEAIDKD